MTVFVDSLVIVVCFFLMSEVIDRLFMPSLDRIAKEFHLSDNIAGATLLAIGTSMPELSIALVALFTVSTSPIVGLWTIVWSALFNILIIIGFVGLLRTTTLCRRSVLRDACIYAVSLIFLYVFLLDWYIAWWESAFFLLLYWLYLVFLRWWNRCVDQNLEVLKSDYNDILSQPGSSLVARKSYWSCLMDKLFSSLPWLTDSYGFIIHLSISLFVIGLSTYFLVWSAESLGEVLWIPSLIISLTVLAVGTSLPELLWTFVVVRQWRGDMAVADAFGSNIFNILVGLWFPLLGYTIWNWSLVVNDTGNLFYSILLLFSVLIFLVLSLVLKKFVLGRSLGILFVVLYLLYVLFVVF